MNKRHYEHTLPNIRGSLSNTYVPCWSMTFPDKVTLFCAILPAGSRQINVNSSPVMNLISVPYKRS